MLELIAKAVAGVVLAWYVVSILVGGVLLARDEWRHRRNRPKPEAVCAYADELEAAHGRDAFKTNGEAMYAARAANDFDRHRFLKAVSGELVRRLLTQEC